MSALIRRRRDATGIFYEILYRARKGITKTGIRRELGLTFWRSEERIGFLLSKGLLCKETTEKAVKKLVITLKGCRLLYFMSLVDQELAGFFPSRHVREFEQSRTAEIEKGITELFFSF